jgi:hypothetical protein
VMLRRAYARDDAVPSAVDEAVTLKVATTYARERLCLLRCVAALATLVTVDTDVAQVARDALTRLLEKVHQQQPPLLAFSSLHIPCADTHVHVSRALRIGCQSSCAMRWKAARRQLWAAVPGATWKSCGSNRRWRKRVL